MLLLDWLNKKEEFVELLKEQIRNKKAKDLVACEIEQHIEDQKNAYLEAGDGEDIALEKAIEQMGDPIDVGKQLDKIHKPKLEWSILLVAITLCFIGVFVQFYILSSSDNMQSIRSMNYMKQIIYIFIGLLFMLTMYFVNYIIIGRYSKALWLFIIVGFFLYAPFTPIINGQIPYFHAVGMLFIPLYGGILYAYRNKGYVGIIKCLIFVLAACMTELKFISQSSVYLELLLSCLIMLTVAGVNNWFGISRRKAMLITWGWIPFVLSILFMVPNNLLGQNQFGHLQSLISLLLHPEQDGRGFQMNIVRQILSSSKFVGDSGETIIGYLPGVNNDYILTFIIGRWGILAGLIVTGLVVALFGRMISIALKQKNSLGRFVGLGCSLVYATQGVIYILSNLGIQLIAQVNLPFVSYGGTSLLINFIVLGIMLSIFRNINIMKEVPYENKFILELKKIK